MGGMEVCGRVENTLSLRSRLRNSCVRASITRRALRAGVRPCAHSARAEARAADDDVGICLA
eukprot:11243180-Alexandrium_andersonii.AAC.1